MIDKSIIEFAGRVAKAELLKLYEPRRENVTEDVETDVEGPEPFERVNITLRCNGRIRGSMSAKGDSFAEQIKNAVRRASQDRRLNGPITRKEVQYTSIEVWIQTSSVELSVAERLQVDCLKLGSDGVEVLRDEQAAYFKPSVAITSGFRSTSRLLNAVCRKAKLPIESWKDDETIVKKTKWVCVFVDQDDSIKLLSYLRREHDTGIEPGTLAGWVSESCDYFRNHQLLDGSVSYIFNPLKDSVSRQELNIVRAAGCLYALSQVIDTPSHIVDEEAKATAIRLAAFLVKHSRVWQEQCRVVTSESGEIYPKVGATALTAAALSYPTLLGQFGAIRAEFQESILRCQLPNGRFMTNFGKSEEGVRQIDFYPGQVLVAMALDVENGSLTAANMCDRAFEPYSTHFGETPATAFVGWHIDAWSRLSMSLDREDYALFAYKQADWLLERQITDPERGESVGGFETATKRPTFSSIVFIEALVSALKLAAHRNDKDRCDRYSLAIRRGLSFCKRLQLAGIPSAFFPSPEKCVGGIALRQDNLNVRCDVVQHFLTLGLAAHANHHLIYR